MNWLSRFKSMRNGQLNTIAVPVCHFYLCQVLSSVWWGVQHMTSSCRGFRHEYLMEGTHLHMYHVASHYPHTLPTVHLCTYVNMYTYYRCKYVLNMFYVRISYVPSKWDVQPQHKYFVNAHSITCCHYFTRLRGKIECF